MLYKLPHANLQNILPSITTINRLLDNKSNIADGIVRFKELKLLLIKQNYPLNVFISEDQTAIIKNVAYDSKSNQLIGFVSPCQENGFPRSNVYVNSVQDIENAFLKYAIGCNAYVYMAQPLIDNSSAFCLAVFASNNKFNYEDVLTRWTDGNTRCLKAMRLWSKIPLSSTNLTRFLKSNVFLPMCSKIVSLEHIKKLIETFSKETFIITDKNFISSNAYTSVKLNANKLLLLIEKIASQPCEKIFKQIRSMTSTYSTVVNFNLVGILRRLNRVEILNEISTDLSKHSDFHGKKITN
ncbi:hypothetical protein PUN28_020765 [Cardiocondyla obscurior]|uniref:Uncharacterized protein n=1 Tax=Cardiocondyla obscurior TaxID=286306 RepID=A0AAW2E997_9HYME